MRDKYILTAESVTEGHPDKLCDTIADSVLDACLKGDSSAHVACEVLATAGKVLVAGEISAKIMPDIPSIVCRTIREAGYTGLNYEIEVITHNQSDDIAHAVREGVQTGAGDQGIVYGFACDETESYLPLPVILAHRLTRLLTNARKTGMIQGLRPDGKAQVSVEYSFDIPVRLASVVLSCQHAPEKDLGQLQAELMDHVIQPALRELPPDVETEILINPSGRFVYGGFEADTGLTGRKLMVDTYGSMVPHGGGAFSGKDCSKVDRSAAYAARYVAKNIVAAGLADKCEVQLSYAIGVAHPTSIMIDSYGTGKLSDNKLTDIVRENFDLRPAGIIKMLDLRRPIYKQTSAYGHFGRNDLDLPWEKLDKVEDLKKYL